jgi:hypothetical protein
MPPLRIGWLLVVGVGVGFLVSACATRPIHEANLACSDAESTGSGAPRFERTEFTQRIEASPFYLLLRKRLGLPTRCAWDTVAGGLRLTYEFRDGGRLEARADPRIGLDERRLSLPGLSAREAAAVMRHSESAAFGEGGCGIAWASSPSEERAADDGTREVIYRGDVCNCQAQLLYRQARLVQVVFGSAC